MISDDIVARLRLYANASIDGGWASVFRSDLNIAADEIERLREALRIEQEESAACAIDRKETQRERDEARREVCEWVAMMTRQKPSTAAKQRGWDCFKVKDVKEWQTERMREAIDSLPSIPNCEDGKP